MNPESQQNVTETIWRQLSNRLRQFVRSRIDCDADVDDVMQTVFLQIHKKISMLRDTDRLESWIFQITRNAIHDHYRKRRVNQESIESIDLAASEENDEEVKTELAKCLGAFVDQLPMDQRRALSMYEFDGLPQQEIATKQGISLSGVKSRIQRGRKSLEGMFKSCCEYQLDLRGNVIDYEQADDGCQNDACSCEVLPEGHDTHA